MNDCFVLKFIFFAAINILQNDTKRFKLQLAPGLPFAAHLLGLRRHLRREKAFKKGRGILGGKRRHSRGINADTDTKMNGGLT